MSTSVEYCAPLPIGFYEGEGEEGARTATQVYLDAIVDAIMNSERSLQKEVGPSEIGSPCTRLLGYKLLGIPERPRVPAWKAFVGTGGHLALEDVFDRYNLRNAPLLNGQERFYIETRVNVGEVNGVAITGSCDLYDRVTGTVVDHKFPGPSMLEGYRKKGPGQQYRAQAHLYGRGWIRAGLPVTRVMIAFLPRHGELADAYIWSEPYDEQVALNALQRLAGVDHAVKALGSAALQLLPTTSHYCHSCSYFAAKSTDLERGCPGDPDSPVHNPPRLDGLVSSTRLNPDWEMANSVRTPSLAHDSTRKQ